MPSPADKAAIRSRILGLRAAVPPADRDSFAARLAILGPSLIRRDDDPLADPVVAAYWPIRGEADTLPLLATLGRVGIVTGLPVTGAPGQPLQFRRWQPGDAHEQDRWRIGQPLETAPLVEPDVLFVPLVAFDRRGQRLGYGAGYYDATLAALRRRKAVRAIGVAFACQEVLFLPSEPHDQPLDLVVTERDLIFCET